MTTPRWERDLRLFPELSGEDIDVVKRLRAGESTALDETMALYWKPLVLYAGRLLGDDLDAGRDVAQESFVRLWEHREQLTSGSIKSYLYRVTHNLTLDELRKRDVRRRWQLEKQAQEDSAPSPQQVLEGEDLERAVNRAISALPLRRREVFTLAYLHRLPYRTVAEVMGISPATVKNQLASALADLRTALRPHLASVDSLR